MMKMGGSPNSPLDLVEGQRFPITIMTQISSHKFHGVGRVYKGISLPEADVVLRITGSPIERVLAAIIRLDPQPSMPKLEALSLKAREQLTEAKEGDNAEELNVIVKTLIVLKRRQEELAQRRKDALTPVEEIATAEAQMPLKKWTPVTLEAGVNRATLQGRIQTARGFMEGSTTHVNGGFDQWHKLFMAQGLDSVNLDPFKVTNRGERNRLIAEVKSLRSWTTQQSRALNSIFRLRNRVAIMDGAAGADRAAVMYALALFVVKMGCCDMIFAPDNVTVDTTALGLAQEFLKLKKSLVRVYPMYVARVRN